MHLGVLRALLGRIFVSSASRATVRNSLQHISTVYYTVVSLACLQSPRGTPKHIQIQMKLGNNSF